MFLLLINCLAHSRNGHLPSAIISFIKQKNYFKTLSYFKERENLCLLYLIYRSQAIFPEKYIYTLKKLSCSLGRNYWRNFL